MKKLMFTVALVATAGAICAQEAGVPPAASETTVAAAAVASDNTLAVAAAASDDGGAAIIAMAEERMGRMLPQTYRSAGSAVP